MTTVIEWLLRQYKKLISPMLLPSCRYVPTCSEYAAEAVACHGIVRGSALALWRLLRCNPFSRGGWDPVPAKQSAVSVHHLATAHHPCQRHSQERAASS